MEFFVTFGQQYATEPHPSFPEAHPSGWAVVEAPDWDSARGITVDALGTRWSGLYGKEDFMTDAATLYPKGELGRIPFDASKDEFGRPHADRDLWREARTMEKAQELTAQWLEGRIHYLPNYLDASFAPETAPLAADLAALNRVGLLTADSQPGMQEEDGSAQRQYVTGFCREDVYDALIALSASTDLVVVGHHHEAENYASIPVTKDGGEPFTWLGRQESGADWAQESNVYLAAELAHAWYVEIFDPVWGRNDLLLPAALGQLAELKQKIG